MKKVGIIMGSDSDLPIIQKAVKMLDSLEIPYEVHVYSAHRTPEQARDFALNARKNGFGAIIAAAGMAAHLAGAIAANTTIPVIGIPCRSSNLDGLDALLSTVMMPTGIPVATFWIWPSTEEATPHFSRPRSSPLRTRISPPDWTPREGPTPKRSWSRTPASRTGSTDKLSMLFSNI